MELIWLISISICRLYLEGIHPWQKNDFFIWYNIESIHNNYCNSKIVYIRSYGHLKFQVQIQEWHHKL